MKTIMHIVVAGVCSMILLLLPAGPAQSQTSQAARSDRSWLSSPLENWNKPKVKIPKTRASTPDAFERCKGLTHKAGTPEEHAVAAAGWVLFGQPQALSSTVIVQGETSVDGMCRPVAYQVFVFSGGKFAGTISPYPMSSREDGSSQSVELNNSDAFQVRFSRYSDSDPLCCPSTETSVSYRIEQVKGEPVLVPANPVTSQVSSN